MRRDDCFRFLRNERVRVRGMLWPDWTHKVGIVKVLQSIDKLCGKNTSQKKVL
jgi:hypothetical protein